MEKRRRNIDAKSGFGLAIFLRYAWASSRGSSPFSLRASARNRSASFLLSSLCLRGSSSSSVSGTGFPERRIAASQAVRTTPDDHRVLALCKMAMKGKVIPNRSRSNQLALPVRLTTNRIKRTHWLRVLNKTWQHVISLSDPGRAGAKEPHRYGEAWPLDSVLYSVNIEVPTEEHLIVYQCLWIKAMEMVGIWNVKHANHDCLNHMYIL